MTLIDYVCMVCMYGLYVCVTIFCMQTYATHVKVQCFIGMLLVIGSEPTYVVALVQVYLVDCLYVVSLILLCNQLIPLTLVIFLIVSHSSGG